MERSSSPIECKRIYIAKRDGASGAIPLCDVDKLPTK